jgi:ATP-dependent helicase/nuclease subunit B
VNEAFRGAPLLVVESEAEVRWSWECGHVALTRNDLRARLRARLAPELVLAPEVAVRLALSDVLTKLAATETWLKVALERGGSAWVDLVVSIEATLAEAHRMTWYGPLIRDSGLRGDPRARTIAAAARELERVLARAGLSHPAAEDDHVARAVARVPPEEVVRVLGSRQVTARGIVSWLPADLVLWRALDARLSLLGGAASIELVTFERPLDAARATDPPGRLVDAVAEALDAAPRTLPITPVLGDMSGGATLESSARVELRKADGVQAEARAIANAVREALSAGTAPDQIAIALAEEAPVRGPVVRLLEEFGIATHLAGDDALAGSGLVTSVLEALAVAERGAPRLAVAALLRSTYLDARTLSGLADDGAARAAIHGVARALERTRSVAAECPSEALARTVLASDGLDPEVRVMLAATARRVGELFERAVSGSNRAEHVVRARRFVEAMGMGARAGHGAADQLAGDLPSSALRRAEVSAFVRDAKGKRRLEAALDTYQVSAERLGSAAPVSFESFRLELERALRADAATEDVPSVAAVRIGRLSDLPSRPLALLVFADAHGEALEPGALGVTLLDAATRARLTDAVEPALRPSIFAARDANAVRLASAAHAARRIVITSATRDDDGALREPHTIVAWLERQGVHTTTWRDTVIVDRPLSDHEERLRALGRARRSSAELRALAGPVAERAELEARRERSFGLRDDQADGALSAGGANAAIQAILVEETGGSGRPMSVTSLDRFGACRFQGFAAQVLRSRKRQLLSEVVGPREEGILLHGALAAAFEATRRLWSERPRDAQAIRVAAHRAATAFLGRETAASRLLRATLDEVGDRVASVVEWSLRDESWDFGLAEAGFGKRADAWEAVVLGNDRNTLRLAGSIDRVDVSHDGAGLRIVDYKRSEDGARRLTEDLGEASFQLAVYARAATCGLEKTVTSGMYLATRRLSPDHRTRGSEAAWLRAHAPEDGLPRFERRALELIQTVRGGDLAPRPARPEVCRFCDHDGACRKPRFVIEGALADDADDARSGV